MKKPYSVKLELYDNYIYSAHGARTRAYRGYPITYVPGDAETMPLTILLTERGEPVTPEPGALATLNFALSDGTRFPRMAPVQPDGFVLYEVTPEDIAAPGVVTVSVTVTESSRVLTWQGFSFTVADSLALGQTEPPDYLEPWPASVTGKLSNHEGRIVALEAGGGGTGGTGPPGPPGADGLSAYEVAANNGFVGTEAEWLASLRGEDGEPGPPGQDAVAAVTSAPYDPEAPPVSAPAVVLRDAGGSPIAPVTSADNVLGLADVLEAVPKGEKGDPGISPEIDVAEETDTSYRLNIITATNTILTPNLIGPISDVTAQALYEHSVATGFEGTYDDWLREYLARQTGLPWCSGRFKDRSLAVSANNYYTPTVEHGDATMVSGNDFVVADDGIYAIVANGGGVNNFTNSYGAFNVFYNGTLFSGIVAISFKQTSMALYGSACYVGYMERGDSLTCYAGISHAQSTIYAYEPAPRFSFMRLS